jgi:hypothetical protein
VATRRGSLSAEASSLSDWEKIFCVNLFVAYEASRLVAKSMIAAGAPGTIVSVARNPEMPQFCANSHPISVIAGGSGLENKPSKTGEQGRTVQWLSG